MPCRSVGYLNGCGLFPYPSTQRHDVALGQCSLHDTDLRGLCRVFADGYRKRKAFGHRAANELCPPVFCQDCNRLLASVAHLAHHMVQRLYLFPTGRQQMQQSSLGAQHDGGLHNKRTGAWGSICLCDMGRIARGLHGD